MNEGGNIQKLYRNDERGNAIKIRTKSLSVELQRDFTLVYI
jgi:hypothetical protein